MLPSSCISLRKCKVKRFTGHTDQHYTGKTIINHYHIDIHIQVKENAFILIIYSEMDMFKLITNKRKFTHSAKQIIMTFFCFLLLSDHLILIQVYTCRLYRSNNLKMLNLIYVVYINIYIMFQIIYI